MSGSLNFRRLLATLKSPAGKFAVKDLNPSVVKAKYAVRGKISDRADELKRQLESSPGSLPFTEIINANIGNPQQLKQKPITFYRQVLSILQNPQLLKNEAFLKSVPKHTVKRAEELLEGIGSVGAYSHSQGVPLVRKSVARFIEERDGYPSIADDIFLTAGASAAVSYILTILGMGPKVGFMIPIPQYPLYTATLAMNDSTVVPYYLDEGDNWSIDTNQLEKLILDSKEKGVEVRCLVMINPGNPTGAILKPEHIEGLIAVAAEHGLVIIADEVYQKNIFKGNFISVKKVLRQLQEKHPGVYDNVQLASLHSTSKGIAGECGQRGGYMELVGFTDEVKQEILKMASISLCPVVTGQALVELVNNPPRPGDDSYEQYYSEVTAIHDALDEKSTKLFEAFNEMEGVSCLKPEGALYCFPKIDIPEGAIAKAKELGVEPDEFYCFQLLNNTGICAVPGSGFGQLPGTWHVRTTFLAPGTEWIDSWAKFHKEFMEEYKSD